MGLFDFLKNLNISVKLNIMFVLAFGLMLVVVIFITNRSMANLGTEIGQLQAIDETRTVQIRFVEAAHNLLLAAKTIAATSELSQAIANQDLDMAHTTLAMINLLPFKLEVINVVNADAVPFLTLPASAESVTDPLAAKLWSTTLAGQETVEILSDQRGVYLVANTPLHDATGTIVGALSVSQSIDNDFLEDINFARDEVHLLLINPKGQIVAQHVTHLSAGHQLTAGGEELHSQKARPNYEHNPTLYQIEGLELKQTSITQALNGATVVAADTHTIAGISQHILAYTPLTIGQAPQAVLGILVRQDKLFFSERQLTQNIILALVLIALGVIIIVAFFAQKSIINPLNKLMLASTQMAAGDYSQRAAINTSAEIGKLGQLFNQMTQAIQEREMELQDLTTSLENRVETRTADLQATNQQLQQEIINRRQIEEALIIARDQAVEADRLKTELLGKVSHELRTPLGIILGYTEIMQEGIYGPLSERQHKAVKQIIKSAEGLTTLVGELLDQAQLEAGKVEFEIVSFSPSILIDYIYAKMGGMAEAKELTFSYKIDETLPETLKGDPERLQQLLINLVGNAIKFTNQGKVHIGIYQIDPLHWAMQVSDTGIGIPQEAQSYIFEPFRQVDGSSTRKHEGTGLGLSLVKQLTILMGGQIALESHPGQGSTFTVRLPLQPIYHSKEILTT